jgi:hypothetical protein
MSLTLAIISLSDFVPHVVPPSYFATRQNHAWLKSLNLFSGHTLSV